MWAEHCFQHPGFSLCGSASAHPKPRFQGSAGPQDQEGVPGLPLSAGSCGLPPSGAGASSSHPHSAPTRPTQERGLPGSAERQIASAQAASSTPLPHLCSGLALPRFQAILPSTPQGHRSSAASSSRESCPRASPSTTHPPGRAQLQRPSLSHHRGRTRAE